MKAQPEPSRFPLRGWATFWRLPDGGYFLSDSYPSEKEAANAYQTAEVDGVINLAKLPETAITWFDR